MARSTTATPVLVPSIFLALLGISTAFGFLPPVILLTYFLLSLLTYLFYYLDKSAARNGGWRTKESTLHILALLGGWPGALLAQQRLRHKTRKQPFRFIFWITILGNLAVLFWLHTADGSAFLHNLFGS